MACSSSPSISSGVSVPKLGFSCYYSPSSSCILKPRKFSCSAHNKNSNSSTNNNIKKNPLAGIGIGTIAALVVGLTSLDADATRIEYYATVGEPLCEYKYVKSGLGYCDILEGFGDEAPLGELINVHYTARFAEGIVFDSSYKRARPLTMRIGAGKVIRGLDQGILGGEGVPPMRIGGKCKLEIPPMLGCVVRVCLDFVNSSLINVDLVNVNSKKIEYKKI